MKNLLIAILLLFNSVVSFSQHSKFNAIKYPSLLWEISGHGLKKPSYLFGTMHVSSKMAFHLSDSFYTALKNAQVVALETNPATWQDDFSRYNMGTDAYRSLLESSYQGVPQDYLSINTLRFEPYEKMLGQALYSSPSIINSFLYRSNSEASSDFEEDTYLDMHIFQVGKKLGKKVCGVEDFDQSMQLVKEAYADAAKEKSFKDKSFDYDEQFSYAKLEEAYRTGNLDLLDTINKLNSTSAAFDEKFLYKRNNIQAHSIDSILRTKQTLFVGVGAAHLPGSRGVIELLRKQGYTLRPIRMNERSSRQKEEIEKIRMPVQFSKQTSDDGFFCVNLPGKLYNFSKTSDRLNIQQYADMTNGSYYIITRIFTNAAIWNNSEDEVRRKLDSVLYENIPGKILSKKIINKNGYTGFDIINKTRRGDVQRYNIFITPFEVAIFKISGNGDYVTGGKEADEFFNSIEFKDSRNEWKKFSPSYGGFEVEMPQQPTIINNDNWYYLSKDQSGNSYEVIRTDIHNHNFVEEDSFDLNLTNESFSSSEFIDKELSRKFVKIGGYPALDIKYKCKDGIAVVRFLIQGPHYYTIVSRGNTENKSMTRFINSFSIKPFVYKESEQQKDSILQFTVQSPVPLQKKKKLDMYNADLYPNADDNDGLAADEKLESRTIENDSTGEKIFVSLFKPSKYFYKDSTEREDSSLYKNWKIRNRKEYELPGKTKVYEYDMGGNSSRMLMVKSFIKDGTILSFQTETDTISSPGSFITSFFKTFTPTDISSFDPFEKKSKVFFNDFFSSDSSLHKKAIKNIESVDLDSSDLLQLKQAIQSLTWKEKKYLDVKKQFISALAQLQTKQSSDLLKEIYFAAADTMDLQYAALQTLLQQKTKYAFDVFAEIFQNDPPVLDIVSTPSLYKMPDVVVTDTVSVGNNNRFGKTGTFLDMLTDSLQLTAGIYKDLLPLINIHDYEEPVMNLTGVLIDKNVISAKQYETYVPKFILEAKQILKKQVIKEKNKAINLAQKDAAEKKLNYYNDDETDSGNDKLSLYATLLIPFWDDNSAIPQIIKQLLNSDDRRLKYNTAILMLRNKRYVPYNVLKDFAASDEFRLELYNDLKKYNLPDVFPADYNNKIDLCKSKLAGIKNYAKLDSIVFIDKLAATLKNENGFVYFFKYKEKKDDNSWKIGSVGLVPSDPKQLEFAEKNADLNVTGLTNTKLLNDTPVLEQLNKELKKLTYSKRKSASHFYSDANRTDYDE